MKYFIIIGFVAIVSSITLYIRYNAQPDGLPKKDIFSALAIMTIIISSIVYQYFNPPLPDVSYKFIYAKKETVARLMSEVTKNAAEPTDVKEYTRRSGSASLHYRYEGASFGAVNIIHMNVATLPKWVEISATTQNNNGAIGRFCYGEYALNLYQNTVNISWNRHDYCWKKENGELDD